MKRDGMFTSYRGITMQQRAEVATTFRALFTDIRPRRVLEIGTADGGLTLLLRDLLDELVGADVPLWTVDHSGVERPHLAHPSLHQLTADTFAIRHHLVDFIGEAGPSVVLCDGGDKAREFTTFAPALKPGDVIMAHDYSPTYAFFNYMMRGQVWDWLEITDETVASVSEAHGLTPYHQDDWQQVAWVCRRKA
jgi:hypothetical protein